MTNTTTVDHVYLFHIHFIIMTTNRKELNGQRSRSIQIDLAGPQWVREGREGKNQRLNRGESERIALVNNVIIVYWHKIIFTQFILYIWLYSLLLVLWYYGIVMVKDTVDSLKYIFFVYGSNHWKYIYTFYYYVLVSFDSILPSSPLSA